MFTQVGSEMIFFFRNFKDIRVTQPLMEIPTVGRFPAVSVAISHSPPVSSCIILIPSSISTFRSQLVKTNKIHWCKVISTLLYITWIHVIHSVRSNNQIIWACWCIPWHRTQQKYIGTQIHPTKCWIQAGNMMGSGAVEGWVTRAVIMSLRRQLGRLAE